jgi:hypothetical protein
MEREIADAQLKIANLQFELDEANRVIAIKDEELGRVKHDFESFKKFHSIPELDPTYTRTRTAPCPPDAD